MTVFKAFLKILNKNKGMIIFYTCLLVGISYFNMQNNESTLTFESSKADVYIKDLDNSKLSQDFVSYIKEISNIKEFDTEEEINDAIFYRDINYYIEIPENYFSDLISNKNPILNYKTTKDYMASLEDEEVNRYLRLVSFYRNQTQNEEEIINLVRNNLKDTVNVEMTTKLDTVSLTKMSAYFNFANYSIMASLVFAISIILNVFNNKNIFKRTTISSMNYKKYSKDLLLSNLLVSLVLFLIYVCCSYLIVKDSLFTLNGLLCILNMFIFVICSTSLAILLGNLIKSKDALGGIINVIAIGTSFLCGAFVPVEYLPNSVLLIGHIFPNYYYINSNNIAVKIETFNIDTMTPLIINYIVLIAFTILFIILSIVIIKKNRKIG